MSIFVVVSSFAWLNKWGNLFEQLNPLKTPRMIGPIPISYNFHPVTKPHITRIIMQVNNSDVETSSATTIIFAPYMLHKNKTRKACLKICRLSSCRSEYERVFTWSLELEPFILFYSFLTYIMNNNFFRGNNLYHNDTARTDKNNPTTILT